MTRPVFIGVILTVGVFVAFSSIDLWLIHEDLTFLLGVKGAASISVLGPLMILQFKGLLPRRLDAILINTYVVLSFSTLLLVHRYAEIAIIRVYYPMIIAFFMVLFASLYFGTIWMPILLFSTTVTMIWYMQTDMDLMSRKEITVQSVFLLSTAFAATVYNYFLVRVRFRLISSDIQIAAQKERLKNNLFKARERNQMLAKREEILEKRLDKIKSQLPKKIQQELLTILETSGGLESVSSLSAEVFSERQVNKLLQFGLSADQILLLSGIYLKLDRSEIQESLFPHLSVRSLENMTSKIRSALQLGRGGDLNAFLEGL